MCLYNEPLRKSTTITQNQQRTSGNQQRTHCKLETIVATLTTIVVKGKYPQRKFKLKNTEG